jgi:hypothetical protein
MGALNELKSPSFFIPLFFPSLSLRNIYWIFPGEELGSFRGSHRFTIVRRILRRLTNLRMKTYTEYMCLRTCSLLMSSNVTVVWSGLYVFYDWAFCRLLFCCSLLMLRYWIFILFYDWTIYTLLWLDWFIRFCDRWTIYTLLWLLNDLYAFVTVEWFIRFCDWIVWFIRFCDCWTIYTLLWLDWVLYALLWLLNYLYAFVTGLSDLYAFMTDRLFHYYSIAPCLC